MEYKNGSENEIIYIKWTFRAAMHQTSSVNKERYSELKNKFLSYKNADGKPIRNTEYRRYSIFYDGKEAIAKITLRQNMMKIYFHSPELSADEEVWNELKLKSKKAVAEAIAQIEKIAAERGFQPNPKYKPQDFAQKFPTLTGVKFIKRERKKRTSETPAETEETKIGEIMIESVGLTSCEHTAAAEGYSPILHDIDLEVRKGEVVGIGGNDDSEVRILCEILGNMRPYYKGYLKLGPIGVKKDKRMLLEHTFYIDNDEMLYGKMTVLEQLLFSVNVSRRNENPIKRQRDMLDLLVENGLKNIALSRIRDLTRGQRIIVALFMAGCSESSIIVANLLDYSLSQDEVEMLRNAMQFFKTNSKTVLFATLQPKLIGMTCEKVLFLYQGTVEYFGTVKQLTDTYDKVVCLIKGDNKEEWAKIISAGMPGYVCSIENDMLIVSNYNDAKFDQTELYKILDEHGITPDLIKLNRGRVENSFQELMVKYDL